MSDDDEWDYPHHKEDEPPSMDRINGMVSFIAGANILCIVSAWLITIFLHFPPELLIWVTRISIFVAIFTVVNGFIHYKVLAGSTVLYIFVSCLAPILSSALYFVAHAIGRALGDG